MKKLVLLNLKSGEEIFCFLLGSYFNHYIFEKDDIIFHLNKIEIESISVIGEIKK